MNFIFKCVNMKNDILFATFLRCIINYSTLFFRSFSFDKKKNSKVLFQPPSSVISHSAGISSDGNFALLIIYSETQRKISFNLQINSFKEILILRNLLNNCQESNTLTFANLRFYENKQKMLKSRDLSD